MLRAMSNYESFMFCYKIEKTFSFEFIYFIYKDETNELKLIFHTLQK